MRRTSPRQPFRVKDGEKVQFVRLGLTWPIGFHLDNFPVLKEASLPLSLHSVWLEIFFLAFETTGFERS